MAGTTAAGGHGSVAEGSSGRDMGAVVSETRCAVGSSAVVVAAVAIGLKVVVVVVPVLADDEGAVCVVDESSDESGGETGGVGGAEVEAGQSTRAARRASGRCGGAPGAAGHTGSAESEADAPSAPAGQGRAGLTEAERGRLGGNTTTGYRGTLATLGAAAWAAAGAGAAAEDAVVRATTDDPKLSRALRESKTI